MLIAWMAQNENTALQEKRFVFCKWQQKFKNSGGCFKIAVFEGATEIALVNPFNLRLGRFYIYIKEGEENCVR